MNWDAIGAVGEIIGALAVVISLLYLAVQIRTQNKQARLAALHEMSKDFREVTVKFVEDDVTDIFVRANEDYASISEAESVRLIILTTNFFRAWEVAFLENRDGHLDQNIWGMISRDYKQPMGSPSFGHIWALRKHLYDADFQRHVDSLETKPYVSR